MGVNHQIFNLVSADGTVLKGKFWKANGFPSATICLVHGVGEHSDRYDSWARKFCEQGIMVYALDYRGHGGAEGARGVVNSLNELHDDINTLVRRCKRNWSEIPNFIYGHSMGGNLVLSYLIKRRHDFDGAIITSPWLELVKPPSPLVLKIARWLNHFGPSITFSTGIRSSQMTHSSYIQKETDIDPLMHGRISVRLFNELTNSSEEIMAFKQKTEIPLLLLHGLADPITSPEATQQFAEFNAPLARFVGYQGALHELHHEPVAESVFNEIIKFIEQIKDQKQS
jgi:alpha-beta hydrolase superfamily lysophospholipase